MPESGTIERAFELARSGTCRSLEDVRRKLKAEGYLAIPEHLGGSAIKKQLAALIKAARDG